MSEFYIRPDAVYRTGVIRPAYVSNDLEAEVESIAQAFTSDPATSRGQYGPAASTSPVLVPAATSGMNGTGVAVRKRPGFIARFFGAK
jgi:hypothetical protein